MTLDSTSAPRRPLAEPTLSDNGFKAMSADEKTARVAEFRNESPEKQALWRRVFQTRRDGVFEISPDGTEKKLEKTEMKEYLDWFGLTRKYGNPPGFKGTVVLDTTPSAAVAAPASGSAPATQAPVAKGPYVLNPVKKKRMDSPAPAAAPAPRPSPVAAPAAAPKAKPDASPAAPAAAPKAPDPIVIPAMPAAVVIPPAPTGDASTMTGDQLAAFNAQMRERSTAMQLRVVELEGLLRQVSDSQIAGKAAQEYLNMKHPMVSATLAATMEHFGPKAGQSAEVIEANMKVFRAIEKRRFALFTSGERVTTSEGVKTIGDAIKNYQSQPWYVRWGLGGAMMHGFAASGATALASSYGLLGAVGLLGAIAPPTLAAIGMGAAARELVFRWFKRRKESGGDRGILTKSPHVTGAVIASLFGYGASLAMTPGSIDTIGNFLTKISTGAGSTLRDLLSMSFFGKKMLGAPIPA